MRILLFFLLSLSTSVVASAQHPVRVDPTHYGFSTSEAGSASTASASSTNRSQDETEIRNVYTRFQQAWNQHDMKAWAGLFAEDADFVNYLGEWWKGRSQIEKNLTAVHAAAFRESTLTDNIDIKYLTSDVAVVHDFWSLVGSKNPDGTAGQSRKGISTQVLRKQAGKWLIADFQNTLTVPNVAFGAELPKAPDAQDAQPPTDGGFQPSTIDHVSIVVNDVEHSADFYQRAFGLSVLNKDAADETIRLKVGSGYLALRHRKDPGRVDHFALGVANFNKESITRDLIQRGVAPEKDEDGDAGFHIKDPDGFRVQITYTGNER